jgi:quercetin dioxygenase-like cupin family protein
VISGKLAITIDGEEHLLSAGDSIYFDSSGAHSYRRVGATPCRAVILTVPG